MIYTDYFLKIQSEFYDKFGNFHRFFASRQSEEIFPRLSEFSIDQFDRGKVVDTRKNQDLPIPSNKKASDGKDLSRRSLQRPGGLIIGSTSAPVSRITIFVVSVSKITG